MSTKSSVERYLERSTDPVFSIVLILPLLMFYNVGLILTDWTALNGADIITVGIIRWLGREGFLWFQATLAIWFLGAILYLKRTQSVSLKYFFPVLGESLFYALTMGTVILFVMDKADLLNLSLADGSGLLQTLTISAGAGVHEEVMFRLLLIPTTVYALKRWTGMNPALAGVIAVCVSSFTFSLAHYLGPESFAFYSFAYRTLAGLLFALLFLFRGLAIAVYTHCLYDVYVLTFG